MSQVQFPKGLSAIADDYDAILCDVWGVIHNGRSAFDAACDALMTFRESGKPVCLITNAPVPKSQVIRYFQPLGVPMDAFDDCVSSGDATRAELERRQGQKMWLMGSDRGFQGDRCLWNGLDLGFSDAESADFVLCMGLDDNEHDDPEDYRTRLKPALDRNLRMICANPDIRVRVGNTLIWCAGALAAIYEEEGGEVLYPGKPHAPIYRLALERLGISEVGNRILCIGDSPGTDVRGAMGQGFDSLYVGTGLKEHGQDFEAEVRELLSDYGVAANWAMPALRW